MKTEIKRSYGSLFSFVKERLPLALVGKEVASGYGYLQAVCRKGDTGGMFRGPEKIALIYETRIDLQHPEWTSDFEDIAREYEKHTGQEITLRIWES
jgi:hypothetical protein